MEKRKASHPQKSPCNQPAQQVNALKEAHEIQRIHPTFYFLTVQVMTTLSHKSGRLNTTVHNRHENPVQLASFV